MSGQLITNASVLQILSQHLHRPVDVAARQRAVLHVLDWLGCAAFGVRRPAMQGFVESVKAGSAGLCQTHLIGKRGWWDALQVNAACGNVLEMDDLDRSSILHPGPVVVPAAIAVAELVSASGEQLLAAIVRGYEATIRIGRALGTSHYKYFHNTSTCGAFGAAAAASDLLGLNVEQTVWALANAGSRTGGLWQMRHEACETKSLHNAQAAQTGVQAAMLARQGVRGPASLLEGPQGLFAATAPGADSLHVLADLTRDWLIGEVSFKPWPACRHAHPGIDAALAIRGQIGDPQRIDAVTISTYQSAINFCDRLSPETEMEAKFSLQHCVAVALLTGAARFADFDPANLHTTELVRLRRRIRVEVSPALTAAFPAHYGAHIKVTLVDGTVLEHLQADAKGDPELALTTEEIVGKAGLLMHEAGIIDTSDLINATLALPRAASVSAWTAHWP